MPGRYPSSLNMIILEWGGWAWPGWNALVAIGTLALAASTVWAVRSERRRNREERWYGQLVATAASLRAAAAAVPIARLGLLVEARRPSVTSVLLYRLAGRTWPTDAATVMETSRLMAATSSLALVESRLTKDARRAAEAYRAAWKAVQDRVDDETCQEELMKAATLFAEQIEDQARRFLRP
jgi:integral membrane sensor domain MASE1